MRGFTLFTVIYLFMAISTVINADKKVICYFGSWAVYRPGDGTFDINYIDPSLCSHLIYGFVGLSGNNIKVLDKWQDLSDNGGKNGFGRFNDLRKQNPKLKTLVAIGGWNEGSTKYSQMAKNPVDRKEFVDNVVTFIMEYGFDGFDIDWEYPAQRGGSRDDVHNFIELLKLLRKAFDEKKLLLSAAVAAAKSSASISYRISDMCKYLDFVNVMSYDLHGAWESQTGLNAPLYSIAGDNDGLSVQAATKYWLSEGCPREKIILGIASYGRSFTLSNAMSNEIGASIRGPGEAGPYTGEPGMLGYNEICEKLKGGSWTVYYDKGRQAPYAYNGVQWVGYDNIESIKKKAEFIKKLNLGGAMVWSIETDDFRGICGEKYPLLKTLNAVLGNGKFVIPSENFSSAPISKNKITTVPPLIPITHVPSVPLSNGCTKPGNIAKPNSCDFISCVGNGNGGYIGYTLKCSVGLCFKPHIGVCGWK